MNHEVKGNSSIKSRRRPALEGALLIDFLQIELDRNFDWSIQYFNLFERILKEKKFILIKNGIANKVYKRDEIYLNVDVMAFTINKLPSRLSIKLSVRFSGKYLAKNFLLEKGKNISPKKDLHCFLNHCMKEYKIACSKQIIES